MTAFLYRLTGTIILKKYQHTNKTEVQTAQSIHVRNGKIYFLCLVTLLWPWKLVRVNETCISAQSPIKVVIMQSFTKHIQKNANITVFAEAAGKRVSYFPYIKLHRPMHDAFRSGSSPCMWQSYTIWFGVDRIRTFQKGTTFTFNFGTAVTLKFDNSYRIWYGRVKEVITMECLTDLA